MLSPLPSVLDRFKEKSLAVGRRARPGFRRKVRRAGLIAVRTRTRKSNAAVCRQCSPQDTANLVSLYQTPPRVTRVSRSWQSHCCSRAFSDTRSHTALYALPTVQSWVWTSAYLKVETVTASVRRFTVASVASGRGIASLQKQRISKPPERSDTVCALWSLCCVRNTDRK